MGERRNLICIELRFSGKNAYVEANDRKSTHILIFEKVDLNLPQGYSRLMTILIGTSGWSYNDWVGPFYPDDMANKKGEWFTYYAKYFKTVEINSTFYRPPGEFQVNSWLRKAPKRFEYSVKMPQLVTHKVLVDVNLENAIYGGLFLRKPVLSRWLMLTF